MGRKLAVNMAEILDAAETHWKVDMISRVVTESGPEGTSVSIAHHAAKAALG
jgi:hypothetical protein